MTNRDRLNLGKVAPSAYQALLVLNSAVAEHAANADLAPPLVELVKIRTSQINGCAFCLQLHTRDAIRLGETPERLAVLPAWRETTYFSPQEGAALALAEAITLITHDQVPDEVYSAATLHLSEEQIAAVCWLAVLMNAFNRIAITSRYPVGVSPATG